MYMHNMEYYRGTPQHGSTVEHGNKGRVTNPSLAGHVKVTISKCNTLQLILIICHRRRARMLIDFLEEILKCLEVASPSMSGSIRRLVEEDQACCRYVLLCHEYVLLLLISMV